MKFIPNGDYSVLHDYPPGAFGSWTEIVAVPSLDKGIPLRVLFYDGMSGLDIVGRFDGEGIFQQEWSSHGFRLGWTHIISTWAGDLLFYDQASGESFWGSLQQDGTFFTRGTIPGIAAGWEQIVPSGVCGLLFYRSIDGNAAITELHNGMTTLNTLRFKKNWRLIPSSSGTILFYDPDTGEGYTGGFKAGEFFPLRAYPVGSFQTRYTLFGPIGVVS